MEQEQGVTKYNPFLKGKAHEADKANMDRLYAQKEKQLARELADELEKKFGSRPVAWWKDKPLYLHIRHTTFRRKENAKDSKGTVFHLRHDPADAAPRLPPGYHIELPDKVNKLRVPCLRRNIPDKHRAKKGHTPRQDYAALQDTPKRMVQPETQGQPVPETGRNTGQ
jgi:hypothetical protein